MIVSVTRLDSNDIDVLLHDIYFRDLRLVNTRQFYSPVNPLPSYLIFELVHILNHEVHRNLKAGFVAQVETNTHTTIIPLHGQNNGTFLALLDLIPETS